MDAAFGKPARSARLRMLCLPYSRIALKMTILLAHNPMVSVRALKVAEIGKISSSEYAIDRRLSRFTWMPLDSRTPKGDF